jgi:arylsulfatase A-like enzyme
MKQLSRVISIVAFLLPITLSAAESQRPPNIVLIFADDLGWNDVGYNDEGDFIETPHLDQLAKEGMIFTNAYAGMGNCVPSRACLLSGKYTPRHDVYAVGDTDRGPKKQMRLVPIPNVNGLKGSYVTFADELKAAGYVTGIFGKWHFADHPKELGFDVAPDAPHAKNKAQEDPKGIYSMTSAACQFMEKNKDQPFLLYVPHHAIHTPLQARKETLARFEAKKPDARGRPAIYGASVYDMDDGIGQLLKKLKDLGLEENTMVVFTSDNGATQQSSQEPLRGSKGGYYEGGIREPMIARWPGVTKAGSTCATPVINLDLFPTFLAVAKASSKEILDGENLMPLLTEKGPLQRQAIFWHFPGYIDNPVNRGRERDVRSGFRSRPVTVIRKGDWKLHLFHEEWQLDGGREKIATNHAVELYHLSEDPGERHDLSSTQIHKRDELLDELLAWQKRTGAKLASVPNPGYDPQAQTQKTKKNKTP